MKLFESFFWGFIAALGALILEITSYIIISPFVDPKGTVPFSEFFITPKLILVAACIEEISKYVIIAKRFNVLTIDKIKLGNALSIGAGFFLFELMLILSTRVSPSPQFLIEIAIIHIGTAGLIGGFLAIKNIRKIAAFAYAMALSLTLHSAYNILLLDRNDTRNYFIFLVLGIVVISNLGIFLYLKRSPSQTSAEI